MDFLQEQNRVKSTKVFVFCVIWRLRQKPVMLLILTSEITARLNYVARFLFCHLLDLEFRLTISQEEFDLYPGPKLVYGVDSLVGVPFIRPEGILFEREIRIKSINVTWVYDLPVFFQNDDLRALIPFDILGASFYLISRYEEYLPHSKDSHGRFMAKESLAMKNGFLELPVVNLWAGLLGKILLQKFPGIRIKAPGYRYIPTIDVDHTYAYLSRTMLRTIGGAGKSVVQGRFMDIYRRIRVLTGHEKDPYDNFGYLADLHHKYLNRPLFFILYANYGGDDNNVTLQSVRFRNLLQELVKDHEIGIHPSVSSAKNLNLLSKELDSLSEVIQKKIISSRQHFLKFEFPVTFRMLRQLGVTHDYSMGYASDPGFRAGTSEPFPFFDLQANEVTELILHPITLMDVTLRDYLRLTPDQAVQLIQKYIQGVRSAGGTFLSLWHNESLCDTGKWKGWRQVYEKMIESASI